MLNSKPNILLLTSRADIGGGPKHVLDLVTNLSTVHADQVSLFGGLPNQHYTQDIVKNLTAFTNIPPRALSIWALWKLLRLCYKHKINLVHSHGRGASYYAFLLSLFGFPFLHTFHGIHKRQGLKGKLIEYIDKFILGAASRYILVSSDEFELFKELGLDLSKVTIIPNGVAIPPATTQKSNQTETIVLGTLTRNDPAKGTDLLLQNFAQAQNDFFVKLQLLVAGEGFPASSSTDSISYLGPQNAQQFLSSLDIYVSNSRKEGMPLAVLEAMAQGVPCVLSDVPGHQYFIKNKVAVGFTLNDPPSFSLALSKVLNEKKRLGDDARSFVSKNHSLDQMAAEILSTYSFMVQKV